MNERLHKSAIFTKLFRALCLRIEGSTEQEGEGEGEGETIARRRLSRRDERIIIEGS